MFEPKPSKRVHLVGDGDAYSVSLIISIGLIGPNEATKERAQTVAGRISEATAAALGKHVPSLAGGAGIVTTAAQYLVPEETFRMWVRAGERPPGMEGIVIVHYLAPDRPDAIERLRDLLVTDEINRTMLPLIRGRLGVNVPAWFPPRMANDLCVVDEELQVARARARIWDTEVANRVKADALGATIDTPNKVALQCAFDTVFDAVGRDWLDEQDRRDSGGVDVSAPLDSHPAVLAWRTFRKDTILAFSPENAEAFDTWFEVCEADFALRDFLPVLDVEQRGDYETRLRDQDKWHGAILEARVFAAFRSVGTHLTVIAPAPGEERKTPDFEHRAAPPFFVECSRKSRKSKDQRTAQNIARAVGKAAIDYFHKRSESRVTRIAFNALPDSAALAAIPSLLGALSHGESTWSHGTVCSQTLAAWGQRVNFFEAEKNLPDASDVLLFGQTLLECPPGTATHANVVGLVYDTKRDLYTTVVSTLKEKARYVSKGGQVPDGSSAILVIDVGERKVADVDAILPRLKGKLKKDHRAVSLLVIAVHLCRRDGFMLRARATVFVPIPNEQAYLPLATDAKVPHDVIYLNELTMPSAVAADAAPPTPP